MTIATPSVPSLHGASSVEHAPNMCLPYVAAPRTQAEIRGFLQVLTNGDFARYRSLLAQERSPIFDAILKAQQTLTFSDNGSRPSSEPLTDEQADAVQELMKLYTVQRTVGQRLGSLVGGIGRKLRQMIPGIGH